MKVYAAINAIQKELNKTGITKGHKNAQQGYQFRGIDDVYNALSPLLAEHGLCILPRVLTRSMVERKSNSGEALFSVCVEAEFDFVCSEDGSKHTVKTFGEAMDSGDKATNKALSAAYKYACIQAFAIPTEGENDADAVTHEVAARDASKTTAKEAVAAAKTDNAWEVARFIPASVTPNGGGYDVKDGNGVAYSTKNADKVKIAEHAVLHKRELSLSYVVNGKFRNIGKIAESDPQPDRETEDAPF